ncbi:MAG TPA: acyl-CoA thioesterase II [Gammaproteobacteria bacterium]
MNPLLADLVSLLELEQVENRIFRGQSRDIGSPRVFGGQVLGQALTAAYHTIEGRIAHSLHAYFLRPGDVKAPIVYDVDIARDGRSFSNRRVVAIQHGRPIFNLAASFQIPEDGLEHQAAMPDVPGPDELHDMSATPEEMLREVPEKMRRFLTRKRPFEVRPVEPVSLLSLEPSDPLRHVWLRAVDKLPEDQELHQNLLAYMSDFQLIGTATLPHGIHFSEGGVQMASLDHAMWFHRPFRVDDWLLYSMESPNAASARGFALGQFFDIDGKLVASAAQEGLVRLWPGSRAER